ncbi:aconitase X [Thalassobacillus devorans]|uniref:aconitase X n=1 Tax=Thalassobacillus devorans TaxID=279813 RepID=UPI001C38B3A4|nr:aconitase X catalytic domain-containing protein [Thalassobacillus devorans]
MSNIKLSEWDKRLLEGKEGKAKQIAMQIIVRMADVQKAKQLIGISQAHIDGCIYTGEASLKFAETLADLNGEVSVPTTLNSISVDQQRWKKQGVDSGFAELANRLAQAYVQMGAKPSFTCSPYQLPEKPNFGEHIAWAESNAVVFANSVIGARTNRYPDFMDICAALTGRAPLSGYHLDEERLGDVLVELPGLDHIDDSFFPVLGYLVGGKVESQVPVVHGLNYKPTRDDLKAFGAAVATSGAVGMFHIVGVTPEAPTVEEALGQKTLTEHWKVTMEELKNAWKELNTANDQKIDLIAFGNPHFSISECSKLADICRGKRKHPDVNVLITTSRYVYEEARKQGLTDEIERFGAEFITDTCWCMIERPVIPEHTQTIMTNSAKYAHYAPGLVDCNVYFGSIEDCVRTATSGKPQVSEPKWLQENTYT